MAHLHGIIGAILRDFTQAQDLSNKYSANLSQEYRENPLLQSFTIPNAYLGDLELELKFAVSGSDVRQRPGEFELEPAARFMEQLSYEIADLVIEGVLRSTSYNGTNKEEYLDFVAVRDKFKKDFKPHLADKLKEHFLNHLRCMIMADGKLDVTATFDAAFKVIEQEMLDHEELKIFSSDSNVQTRTDTEKIIHNLLDTTLDNATEDFPDLEMQYVQDLDVIVSSDELAGLPAHLIQTVKMKLNLREYNLSQREDNGTVTPQLLPAH